MKCTYLASNNTARLIAIYCWQADRSWSALYIVANSRSSPTLRKVTVNVNKNIIPVKISLGTKGWQWQPVFCYTDKLYLF